ncbi:unnamed protein product [Meganyctiphanes norvegica]|uniref:Uncharacterized protein n=1 Tax=Meganyctiphanes norvegica TaxID=48144 RepID=A0AAV2QQ01_MEGNR
MHRLLLLLTLVQGVFLGPVSLSGAPTLIVEPQLTSVVVRFIRTYPWNTVSDYDLFIYTGLGPLETELCSHTFTCTAEFPDLCTFNTIAYCDPLPPCTSILVVISFYNRTGLTYELIEEGATTLCETTTSIITTTPTTTGILEPRHLSGVPDLTLIPHMISVDIIFLRVYPWNGITDYTFIIYKGTDGTEDDLCSQAFTCTELACKINSDEYCNPLPPCTDVFVEVMTENDEFTSESTKTLCKTTTTTIVTTASTTTEPTTSTTPTTTTTPSVDIDLILQPHMTFVDVLFFRVYPWNEVTDYTLIIFKGTDESGDELCHQPFTCSEAECIVDSGTYCDPLPPCTDVAVGVTIQNANFTTESTTTLCETTTTTIVTTTPTTTEPSTITTSTPPTTTASTQMASSTTLSTTTTPETTHYTTTQSTTWGCSTYTSSSTSTTTSSSTESISSQAPSVSIITTTVRPGVPLRCFYCSDDQTDSNYDSECGRNGYDGVSDTSYSHHSCYVTIWNDGSKIVRGMTGLSSEPGFCDDLGDRMTCYCITNDCNSGLCRDCFVDHTTPKTTRHPTQPTLPPASTASPGTGLECYSCIDCQTVTEDTPTAVSQNHLSCFISIIAESGAELVIRGGDAVPHIDGDCVHEDGAFICYCSTNLCNMNPAIY